MNPKCEKCINGVIMKQIAVAEYIPEHCECVIKEEEWKQKEWFKMIKSQT